LPFPNGVWEVLVSAEGVERGLFTPEGELPLYSFVRGRVIKKDDRLGGFFVDLGPFGEGFLPFGSAGGARVGEEAVFQVARESLEGKPPRLSRRFFLPLCGCDAVFDGRARVEFLGPPGEVEPLKKRAGELGLSLRVRDAAACLGSLEGARRLLERVKGETLLWSGAYTLLLRACGGTVRTPEGKLCRGLDLLRETFGLEVPCRVESLRNLLRGFSPSREAGLLFKERVEFDGGFLLVGGAGYAWILDFNGSTAAAGVNRGGLLTAARLVKRGRLGGRLLLDPVGGSSAKDLKTEARRLFTPEGCSVLGFTNGGFLEVRCPLLGPSVSERLSRFEPSCSKRVKKDRLLLYEVLERLYALRGEAARLTLHPSREGLKEELPPLYEGRVEFSFDWRVEPDRFLLEVL